MINEAFAQSSGAAGGFSLGGLIPFILIFVIFYFLLIRPQQKKVKEHKNMVQGLKRGDNIITAGGMVGKIVKAVDNSDEITVEISKGINVNIIRHMVSELKNTKK